MDIITLITEVLPGDVPRGPARLAALQAAIVAARRAGASPSLEDVARAVRRRWAPWRRFIGPIILGPNTSVRGGYEDAFAEEILGEPRQVATWCRHWPVTVQAQAAAEECRAEWRERLGLNGANHD